MKNNSSNFFQWFLVRPKVTGFIFFILLLCLLSLIISQRYQLFKENKKREVLNVLNGVEDNLEQSLKNYQNVALSLALTLNSKGEPEKFEEVAAHLINANPSLQAVQLVPDGVIKYVYPLKGNEAVVNLDLHKSPPQTILEFKKAIKLKKMYYQGPVKLTQGGIGVIGRLPIFIENKFWGFSAVVIKLDTLFKYAGLYSSKYKQFKFQFSKRNPITLKEEFFMSNNFDLSSSQSEQIVFADGDWKLYISDMSTYDTWRELITAVLFGLTLATLSSYFLVKFLKNQLQLQKLVSQQATHIKVTENKYKNIFDKAAVGIARVNAQTGLFLEANPSLCELLGYTETELMSKKIKSVIYAEDLQANAAQYAKLLKGEIKQFNIEERYLTKAGQLVWVNVVVSPLWKPGEQPTTHIAIIEDVTKRKKEEQILIQSQKRIESLINTVDGIVWEGYPDNDTYTFISNKITDVLGYTPEECLSIPHFWENHLYGEDKQQVRDYITQALNDKSERDFEYRMLAKDGTIVWIRDIVAVIEEEGQPLKLRGIMIDITKRKESEEALKKSFSLVTEQNKRLLNFSYIVSHNLRSHAGNIQGISSLIESAKTDEERAEMIQLLKKVGHNLNETLYNLNNIVNIQTSIDIAIEPLNLYDYINKSLNAHKATILAKEAIILNKVDQSFVVNYNRAYLDSILLNFISNALRYASPDRQPKIEIDCVQENNKLVLTIADNGIGIDLVKYQDKLFNIYQTFSGNADARGFGLFISKNQVEAMGGKITVESELNVGTTFKIYFK